MDALTLILTFSLGRGVVQAPHGSPKPYYIAYRPIAIAIAISLLQHR